MALLPPGPERREKLAELASLYEQWLEKPYEAIDSLERLVAEAAEENSIDSSVDGNAVSSAEPATVDAAAEAPAPKAPPSGSRQETFQTRLPTTSRTTLRTKNERTAANRMPKLDWECGTVPRPKSTRPRMPPPMSSKPWTTHPRVSATATRDGDAAERPAEVTAVSRAARAALDEKTREQTIAACESLARLYGRVGLWAKVVDAYQRQAELTTDPAAARALRLRIADVYERELGQGERAIDAFEAMRAADPDDEQALAALDRLYEAHGRWDDLQTTLERHAKLATGSAKVDAGPPSRPNPGRTTVQPRCRRLGVARARFLDTGRPGFGHRAGSQPAAGRPGARSGPHPEHPDRSGAGCRRSPRQTSSS